MHRLGSPAAARRPDPRQFLPIPAFRLAGAQNIIMSLWRVPDVQTRMFMEKFYAELLVKGDIRRAFQSARQNMRKEFDNPFYWAGFVLLE